MLYFPANETLPALPPSEMSELIATCPTVDSDHFAAYAFRILEASPSRRAEDELEDDLYGGKQEIPHFVEKAFSIVALFTEHKRMFDAFEALVLVKSLLHKGNGRWTQINARRHAIAHKHIDNAIRTFIDKEEISFEDRWCRTGDDDEEGCPIYREDQPTDHSDHLCEVSSGDLDWFSPIGFQPRRQFWDFAEPTRANIEQAVTLSTMSTARTTVTTRARSRIVSMETRSAC